MNRRRHSFHGRAMVALTVALILLLGTGLSGVGSASPFVHAEEADGAEPIVLEEFEDLTNLRASHAQANSVELSLISRPETIYYGHHAVKLSYDFIGQPNTSAAYVNFYNPDGTRGRAVPGQPRKLGVWVYGNQNNNWLRAAVADGSGKALPALDFTTSSGFDWQGWKYVTADVPQHIQWPLKLNQIYMAATKSENKNSGAIYFDRLSAIYSSSPIHHLDIAGLPPHMQAGSSQAVQVVATRTGSTAPERIESGVQLHSSDETVAAVTRATYDSIAAVGAGTAIITAEYGDAPPVRLTLTVTEDAPKLERIEVSGPQKMVRTATGALKAYAVYAGLEAPVEMAGGASFASSRPEVVSVDDSGGLEAHAIGSAAITVTSVTYRNISAIHQIEVTEPVPELESIQLRGLSAVAIGGSFEAEVYGTYSWVEEPVKIAEGVKYASSNPEVAPIDENGKVTGIKVGGTRIMATYEGKTSSVYVVVNKPAGIPKAEMRAAWIATVENIDWPAKGTTGAEEQKQQYRKLLDELQAAGMNAVIMQIKPTADAFYPSEYGPWSEWLTGVQGKDPGYDPLAFMLEETHKRNMEFHAWFNPYRVSMKNDIERLVEDHPARKHPDWVLSFGGKLYFDPGNPEARQFITDSVMEVVKKYDIDAVHFDDYFYPYPIEGTEFPDDVSYAKYGAGFPDRAAWRRDNVNQFIRGVGEAIKLEKSYVKFGISPFGIWKNKSKDPEGSDTNGLSSYEALNADSKKWVEEEWIDYITPQIYWYMGYSPAAYDTLIAWWSGVTAGKNVHLYSGQAIYRIGQGDGWMDPEEMPNQVNFNRNFAEVSGSMYFSAQWFAANPLGFTDRLRSDLYRYPALVPAMPWLDAQAPAAPSGVSARNASGGVELKWKTASDETYYAVYRFEGKTAGSIADPSHLLGTIRKKSGHAMQAYADRTAAKGQQYTYVVTAVDRLHNESVASEAVTLTAAEPGAPNPAPLDPPSSSGGSSSSPAPAPSKPSTPSTPTVPAVPPVEPAVPVFPDLAPAAWAQEAIQQLAALGIVKGDADGKFRPLKPVTRAEFAAMLVRAFDLQDDGTPLNWSDVKETDWHYTVIAAAKQAGLVQGTGKDRFEPNRPITRQEMAVMAAKALAAFTSTPAATDAEPVLARFKDRKAIASYAAKAVATLAQAGIVKGTGSGLFHPKGEANRAQAAIIVWKIVQKK
ncbi:MAG: family 10 glycosylhydrolase [Paenibacillus dendritiformis]|uniref:family 10 glycosylhydrolase n=1 Tax=uncultured Paenibacillus sp. TaxID=227322 RepID=UPI0025F956B5|nr:family 10 glycosylhydrolase [uncultured Paenibacillus sp.]MDU5143706.1 family 10 glycosylhydrolase [Paenibacillus dendritiformis]